MMVGAMTDSGRGMEDKTRNQAGGDDHHRSAIWFAERQIVPGNEERTRKRALLQVTQRGRQEMPNWSEFNIKITGPRADQQHIVALFEQCKQRIDDQGTPWFFNFIELVDRENTDPCFWSPEAWHEWRGNSLVIHGEMKWVPPLYIVDTLAEIFPELTFDVTSTTEHEWLEHWRTTSGEPSQLIEDLVINLQEDAVVRYWLREGEESVFSVPARQMPSDP